MSAGSPCYRQSAGVRPLTVQGRPALSLPQGGCVIVDRLVMQIWQQAHQRTLAELLVSQSQFTGLDEWGLRATLTCLAESGLLERTGPSLQETPLNPAEELPSTPLVSVILVSYNSQNWLSACLPTLLCQTYPNLEILIADNASRDGTCEWVNEWAATAGSKKPPRLIRIDQQVTLAAAWNRAAAQANGEYWLFLNPDTQLHPNAILEMMRAADSDCAAVAANLRLMSAPAFLNGLGSYVGAFAWGTDLGLGHLDLGQWDSWRELPSACFAAALISRRAWEDVGTLDENFPMYYEDSEWCYRARLMGYRILAAPRAIVYHAFSGQLMTSTEQRTIQLAARARKMRHVTYGRLRWAGLILSPGYQVRFYTGYVVEDLLRLLAAMLSGHWQTIRAILQGWVDFMRALPEIQAKRRVIQRQRKIPDRQLLKLQRRAPLPLIWRGYPLLTGDIVCRHYLPLLMSGITFSVPEWPASVREQAKSANLDQVGHDETWVTARQPFLRRLQQLWHNEGISGTLHRFGRELQHWLSIM